MNESEYPLEKTDGQLAEVKPGVELRRAPHRYMDSSTIEAAGSPGFDSLLEYWRILFRHRKTLLRFTVGGLLAAIVISLLQTPTYRVRTSLELQGANLQDMKNSSDMSGSYGTPESYVDTQVKLLQSESLIEDVIDKLNLHKLRPTGWRAWMPSVENLIAWLRPSRVPEKEELIRQIQRNLTVRTSGNSHLLEVLYESPDPHGAADFANKLVSDFIELSQEVRWKSAQGTVEWLTGQLDQMKSQLEQSEEKLQDYALDSGLSFASEKENLQEDRLKELQDDLTKAQADRIANQAKLEGAKSKPPDSLPEILEDPTMRDYRQKLSVLQQQYAELSATLTPEHYKVQRVQAQIAELQSEMQKERTNVVRRIGNEYTAAVRRETLLSKAHDVQEKVVADQTSMTIHYDTLKRDVDSNRRLYETMLLRVKEAGLTAAMRDSNALIVDHAKPPLLPYSPNVPMNSAIGLFGGMLFGFGFLLFRERVDRRISNPGDAQIYLDLPELGVMPLDEVGFSPSMLDRLHIQHSRASLPPNRVAASSANGGPELATWKRKPSLLAECARTTLTSILLPSQDREGPRVIVLTSPCPGDGKTTVACNLSIAMAEIGRKVLLIDGDLRRPRLHKVFGVSNDWGLCDVLWSDTPLETVPISHLVRETEVSGLFLMSGGCCGVTPSNLLYSPRMTALLKRLPEEFDMIMIDAPPMIHLADARVLGRVADGVILVIRSGETTTESAQVACQRFAEDGTRVLGFVLNRWDPKNNPTYGYGKYDYVYDQAHAGK
jgi:polysaccharide biosynthesis transport protein